MAGINKAESIEVDTKYAGTSSMMVISCRFMEPYGRCGYGENVQITTIYGVVVRRSCPISPGNGNDLLRCNIGKLPENQVQEVVTPLVLGKTCF